MLDWREFVAKEHQRDLIREAQRQRLIGELRAARRRERSRLRDRFQKESLRAARHRGSPCLCSARFPG